MGDTGGVGLSAVRVCNPAACVHECMQWQAARGTANVSIVHLVSASVPYLATQDVTVVDHYGNLLTGSNAEKDGTPALNNARFEAEREAELADRIRELLIPALGGGNVRTVVNLEMDFTQRETTTEQ